jgi:hypothetical protein
MSVGGKIVAGLVVSMERVWVNTYDGSAFCEVFCDPQGEALRIGDSLWWQSGKCYWTPKSDPYDTRVDVPLRKLGYSGTGMCPLREADREAK